MRIYSDSTNQNNEAAALQLQSVRTLGTCQQRIPIIDLHDDRVGWDHGTLDFDGAGDVLRDLSAGCRALSGGGRGLGCVEGEAIGGKL